MKQYAVFFTVIFSLLLFSCAEPSPLYGTWADNNGDQIMFMSDGTYTATITDQYHNSIPSDGTYSVLLNALSLTSSSGRTLVTEWDIRGNMLYLTWLENGENIGLTLYKIRN